MQDRNFVSETLTSNALSQSFFCQNYTYSFSSGNRIKLFLNLGFETNAYRYSTDKIKDTGIY